jgi:hypothetical protein
MSMKHLARSRDQAFRADLARFRPLLGGNEPYFLATRHQ